MPIEQIKRTLTTSVDRFAVYHPKPISDGAQSDKTFYVLGERIEIIHERRHSTEVSVFQNVSEPRDRSELKGTRKRADSDPEGLSSPPIATRTVKKRDFKIARSQDTELSEMESGTLGSNNSSSEETSGLTINLAKRFEHADWNFLQKRAFYQSFAQKPHDFPVFISKEEAIREMEKYTVVPLQKGDSVRIGSPIFKVIASESEIGGQKTYTIHHIAKIYFQDKACRVYADMGQINTADKRHTDANDFLFTVNNIKDNIPPLVKISQDLKVPLILFVLTFITQVIQILITNYLPNNDSNSC